MIPSGSGLRRISFLMIFPAGSKNCRAVATIKNPAEKWYQYRQTNYVQVYRKTTGCVIACMVTVLSNGQRRTYYTPNVSRLDDSVRKGFRVDVFNKKKKEPSN